MDSPENILSESGADETTKIDLSCDIKQVSACERHITVTIPREEVDRYFQKDFDELNETAYVPGFRVGKAPRALIEKRFRKEVAERVKSSLIIDALGVVNEDTSLTPISEPDLDYAEVFLPEEGPFVFEFNLEVRPEFDLPEWKGLKLEKPVREFDAADIDRAVERILANSGHLDTKDGPAEAGDYLDLDMSFACEGKTISSAKNEVVRIRKILTFHDGAIEGFDTLMVGVNAGESRTAEFTLSEEAANTEYRGKKITASFLINQVRKMSLPELDKTFLETLGGFDNIGDFRDAVLDVLKRQLEHEQHQRARRQITEKLTVAANWELPPGLLKRQSERELRRAVMELQRSGYSNDDIVAHMNVLRQNSATSTAQALKEHFILEKIAEIESIEDEQVDYDMEIALIASQSGQSPRRIRAQLEKSGEMDILRNQIIERKVISQIMENAQFTEVPFDFDAERDEEAIDLAAAGAEQEIAEVDAEDLKAVNKEAIEKRMIDPNVKK